MSELNNVTVTKAANIYFDGKVTSRTLTLADGSTQSLGIMLPGNYEFGTAQKEIMDIISGDMQVLLPGSEHWQNISGGQSFQVPANSTFSLKVTRIVDYCCVYISE